MSGRDALDYGIFGMESGGANIDKRDAQAGQCDRANDHHPVGFGNMGAQTPHASHVLFIGHGMDDGSGAQEQQCLEEGMREQMEYAGTKCNPAVNRWNRQSPF